MRMTVEDKLGADKFSVDEEHSHILVDKACRDAAEIDRVVRVCPAALYKKDGDGVRFDYLGCLECGTCRVLSGGQAGRELELPRRRLRRELQAGLREGRRDLWHLLLRSAGTCSWRPAPSSAATSA